MSDNLPGWTCPDIEAVIKLLRKARKGPLKEEELDKGLKLMEELRQANIQLRKRCVELLNA